MLRTTLCLSLCLLVAACSKTVDPSASGNSNWLRGCGATDECGADLQCVCNVCTTACSDDSACASGASGATQARCQEPEGKSLECAASAVEHASGDAIGICVAMCDRNEDCNFGMQCVRGACLSTTVPPDLDASVTPMDAGSQMSTPGASGHDAGRDSGQDASTDLPDDIACPQDGTDAGSGASCDRITFAFMGCTPDCYLYVARLDGRVTLVEDEFAYGPKAWSPDGQTLVFGSTRDGNVEIYASDPDGTNPRNLSNNPFDDELIGFVGEDIAFYTAREGSRHIWVMRADGSDQHELLASIVRGGPSFSPDGTKLAAVADGNLSVMSADGTGAQVIAAADFSENQQYPAWSPDSSRIAFVSTAFGNDEIHIINADGSDEARLTKAPAVDSTPCFSPDGRQLVFDRAASLHVMNADGTNEHELTVDLEDAREPIWRP